MTAKELVDQGFKKIRKPFWNEKAYLELHVTPDKMMGPWVTLHDVGFEQKMLFSQAGLDETDWEGVDDSRRDNIIV